MSGERANVTDSKLGVVTSDKWWSYYSGGRWQWEVSHTSIVPRVETIRTSRAEGCGPPGGAGPHLREGKLGSCPGPPQLGGLHKDSKNYYLRKHKNTF